MMPFPSIAHQPHCVALDIGTAWTRAATSSGRQCSLESPSPLWMELRPEQIDRMDEAPPRQKGEVYTALISDLLREVRPHAYSKPNVVAAISACASPGERQHFTRLLRQSGVANIVLVPQPFAAAIGAGLDPGSEHSQMMIDIGEGCTEFSVVRARQVIASFSQPLACAAIKARIAHRTGGCVVSPPAALRWLETHSLDEILLSPLPGLISRDLAVELRSLFGKVAQGACRFFRELPDSIACEVIESGITLVGGGALIRDLREEIAKQTFLSVHVPGNPLTSAIEGAAQVIPFAAFPVN